MHHHSIQPSEQGHHGEDAYLSLHTFPTASQAATSAFCPRLPCQGAHADSSLFSQLKEVLISLAQNVHNNEEGCVKYLVYEQRGSDAERPDMVLVEEWLSQEVLDHHHGQSYLKETHKIIEEEDLVYKPELIKIVDQVWGFQGR